MITIWTGPVNFAQLGPYVTVGDGKISVPCTGDGSPSCADLAEGFLAPDGTRLASLLASRGVPSDESVAVGAFSAGGSLAKRLCLSSFDRAQIRVLYCADAMYTTDRGVGGGPAPIDGFVLYAVDAIVGASDKIFVATASASPNKAFGSGIEVMRATRAEIERRVGQSFSEVPTLPGSPVAPSWAGRLGDVWFAEYEDVPHGEHATQLAGPIWRDLIRPSVVGVPVAVAASSESSAGTWVAVGLGVVAGWGVASAFRPRHRRPRR